MLMDILAIKCRESMREDKSEVYGVSIDGATSNVPEKILQLQLAGAAALETLKIFLKLFLTRWRKLKKTARLKLI